MLKISTKLINKFAWIRAEPHANILAHGFPHPNKHLSQVHIYPDNTEYKEIMNCDLRKKEFWVPIQLTKSQYIQIVLDNFNFKMAQEYPKENRWKKIHKITWKEFNEKTGLNI